MNPRMRFGIVVVALLLMLALYRVGRQAVVCSRMMAVNRLIAQFKTGDDKVIEKAAVKLAKIGAPAVKPLVKLLGDKDIWAVAGASVALGKMGTTATEPLKLALHDANVEVRSNAAIALCASTDPRAIGILISAFRDKSHRVGHCAALSLWHKGGAAVAPLLVALADKNANVRADAAMALGGIKDKRATLPLINALNDKDKVVRLLSAQALGTIHDARAVEPLLAMFQERSEDADGRYRAGVALGQIGDDRAIEPLIRVLADKTEDSRTRSTAAFALDYFKAPRVIDALIAEFGDKDRSVREDACSALGRIGQPATRALLVALRDTSPDVRSGAALAFASGFSVDNSAVEPLITALADKDAVVRRYAAAALTTTEAPRARTALLLGLTQNDIAIVAGAFYFFIEQGRNGSEPLLNEALRTYGDHSMASDFYNSGNAELHKAAVEWAKKHGETLDESDLPPHWGSSVKATPGQVLRHVIAITK